MNDADLGPIPEPTTEEPELNPGGADALHVDPADGGLGRDLDPDGNPAVDDVLPDEIAEPDDKQQEPDGSQDEESDATRSSDSTGSPGSPGSPGSTDSTGEPAAGQEAEDGSPEPPA